MTTMTEPRKRRPIGAFRDPDARWRAVVNRDRCADGAFVFAVRTTGVYCRPSCAARRARRENVTFFASVRDAARAGFRACLRCRPDQTRPADDHAELVAKACTLIRRAREMPDLNTLAAALAMSPSHLHRVFKAQTGVTPRGYAAAHRTQRLHHALSTGNSVTRAIYAAGFNSSGRLYASSDKVLGMTPGTFRAGGSGATIRFAVGECSLGSILVAASERGICSIALGDGPDALLKALQDRFPKADLIGGDEPFERWVADVVAFVDHPRRGLNLPLDVRGTAFQHRVWRKLCEIPCGATRSYSEIARSMGEPNATRAVARACAANAIAVAIPCHRVVRTDGSPSGYRWGLDRKAKLLNRERGQVK